jgi:TM2 domain-containing membrane protein YozV
MYARPQKNAGLAAVLSFFIPGLGQIYNGEIVKGIIIIIVQIINGFLAAIIVGFITGAIVWIWAIYDAYKTAERINAVPGSRLSGPPRY